MVTASLSSSARPGQRIDVVVSSAGDATSLEGGVLQLTQLLAPNGEAYAVAQGPLSVGGFSVEAGGSISQKNHTTVGRVPLGGTVERENPNRLILLDQTQLDLLLRHPDYTTAKRMADSINSAVNSEVAIAVDSAAVAVTIPEEYRTDVVSFLALIELVDVQIDSPARVVINERTGTVVMGSKVKISPVAVTHGGLSIEVRANEQVSQPNAMGGGNTVVTQDPTIVTREDDGDMVMVGGNVTIGELVNALNEMKVKPRELIQILITIKASGAMQADLEVI